MSSRIVFECVGGLVMPTFPDRPDGTPVETDGVRFLSAHDAARRLDVDISVVEEVYNVFLNRVVAAHEPNARSIRNMLREKYKDISEDHFECFMAECARRGLDPTSRHIWVKVGYNDFSERLELSIQLTVDGFYSLANSSDKIEYVAGPQWCGMDGVWKEVWTGNELPVAARTIAKRRDKGESYVMVSHMSDNQDLLDPDRHTMPVHILGKRSACGAIRRALAERLDGIYASEEMRPASRKQKPGNPHKLGPDTERSVMPADDDGEDPLQSPRQFVLAVIDFGYNDPKKRDAMLEEKRNEYPSLYSKNLLGWRRRVIADLEKAARMPSVQD